MQMKINCLWRWLFGLLCQGKKKLKLIQFDRNECNPHALTHQSNSSEYCCYSFVGPSIPSMNRAVLLKQEHEFLFT